MPSFSSAGSLPLLRKAQSPACGAARLAAQMRLRGVGFTFAWLHRPEVVIDGDNPLGGRCAPSARRSTSRSRAGSPQGETPPLFISGRAQDPITAAAGHDAPTNRLWKNCWRPLAPPKVAERRCRPSAAIIARCAASMSLNTAAHSRPPVWVKCPTLFARMQLDANTGSRG